MAFDNTVPQPNEQQAQSQPKLLANNQAIQANMIQDHAWVSNNIASQADGTHQKVSLPNISDPVALGTGINGILYSNLALPKWYNGAVNYLAVGARPLLVFTGTVSLTTSAATFFTVPANTTGEYFIFKSASALPAYSMGQFITGASTGVVNAIAPGMTAGFSGLLLQAQVTSAANNGTYTYVVKYVTP